MTDQTLNTCNCTGMRFSASVHAFCTAVPDAKNGLCAFCAEWCHPLNEGGS